MHIHCLGISHQTAALSLRESLAFSDQAACAALSRLGCGSESRALGISEMVILSTCNRVEIYTASASPDFNPAERFLQEAQGVPLEAFAPSAYRYLDDAAVEHLFRVASGLDSLVLGEPQILGQVMAAFERARSQGAVGPVLSKLFQAALHAGKRARAETAISANPASISSVAIRHAEQVVSSLPTSLVCVVGAGEMAELAVEALRKRGVDRILVVNRTLARARLLADRWGGVAATFEKLPEALQQADILITSTGAPHTLIHTGMVAAVMPARQDRPMVIIDIAVPRNVDMEVGEIAGVRLFDLDMLQASLEESLTRRAGEVPQVEAILAAEKQDFLQYLRLLEVTPLIAELRQQAECIRQGELEKTLRRMPELTEEEKERLEAMTQALVKKMLHAPIARLREEAGNPQAATYATAARSLFGLEEHTGSPSDGLGLD